MKTLSFSLLAAALATGAAFAATAYTTPVGYNTVACPSNSDTVCSVPLSNSITFAGTTGVPVDNANGTHTMVLSGNPNLDQSVKVTYYVKFNNGTHDGEVYQITDKTLGATIVVDDLDNNLTNVAAGTLVEVVKFWTLETLFPDGNTTIVPSTGTFPNQRKTTILIPTTLVGGINVAPQQTFFYNNATTNWRSTASGFPVSDDLILWPDTYFLIRHDPTSGPTNFVPAGLVDENNFTVALFTSASTETDNFVAIPRPIEVRLDDLGLGDANGASPAFVASTGNFPNQRGDTLLVFNNATALQNKAPSSTYFFRNTDNTWRSTASGFPLADATLLNPSEGFIIRKKATVGGVTSFWVNPKNW